MSQNIYQGDNTAAFGGNFLTIRLVLPEGQETPPISKAELKIGCVFRSFENPVFPMTVNLSEEETAKLQTENTGYLALWDAEGRKKTCNGKIVFNATPRRV